jgi:hypothetical protein
VFSKEVYVPCNDLGAAPGKNGVASHSDFCCMIAPCAEMGFPAESRNTHLDNPIAMVKIIIVNRH